MSPQPFTQNKPGISLILPAWNESEVISTAIAEADTALRGITDRYEIIVVDDGSTDNTGALVEQAAEANPAVRLVQHQPNQGYGASLRSGFAAANMELVAFTDADCQFDLTELDRFVLLSQHYDIVCGYRIDRQDTALRCLYSKVYNQLVRLLLRTGVRDVDCAMKMFHRDVVQQLKITGNGFLVNSELLVQANQQARSVVEVGVTHRPRTQGTSTVSVSHIPKVLCSLARYWWNAVQFPQPDQIAVPMAPRDTLQRNDVYLQLALLLMAAVFLLTNLSYPLIDRDETRYAEVSREMLATGNWALPQLNFRPYYDKPPLLYWLCALSFQLFGTSEASARLIPALASLATVGTTMFFGSRIFGSRIGLLSGVALLLSIGFALTSRYLLLDGLLSLLVALSLFTAYEAIRGDRLKLVCWLFSGVFCGLAFLTKGPLAVVLLLPSIFAFTWLTDGTAKPKIWHYGIIVSIVAAIVTPWMIAVSMQDSSFLIQFFYRHNLARFAGEFHVRPIWYFIPVLLIAGHPWSFLTIPYAKFLFQQQADIRCQRPPAIGFFLLWSGWCFAFFTMSSCKLPTYLLPAAPALALLVGHYLDQIMRDASNSAQHRFARFWSARWATATTCFAGVGLVVFLMIVNDSLSVGICAWALLWAGLLVSSLVMLGDRHQAKLAWASSAGFACLLLVMLVHHTVPTYSRTQSLFGAHSPLSHALAHDDQIAIATIDHEFSEVPFYLNRQDIPNFSHLTDASLARFVSERQHCMLIVTNEVTPRQILQQLPVGAKLTGVGQHGTARFYDVQGLPANPRLGQTKLSLRKGVPR